MRWPLSGTLFTLGFTGLSIISFLYAWVFLRNYRNLAFLRYIGFSSSLILSVVSLGLLWKFMHWPVAGIIISVGLGLFIPFLFAFVFTLPGSDYINWNKTDRMLFFRAIIIPMTFVYTLCVLMFVLPELWNDITRLPIAPFNMSDFELISKPGIYLR